MADIFAKVQIYAPDIMRADELAATMDLHLYQWEWVGPEEFMPDATWADLSPLYEQIEELQERLELSGGGQRDCGGNR